MYVFSSSSLLFSPICTTSKISLTQVFSKSRQPMPPQSSISANMGRDEKSLSHGDCNDTRTMKRKRSGEIPYGRRLRRQTNVSTPAVTTSKLLVDVLSQYGLLNMVVSYICAEDLLALILTSRALHEAIIPRSTSLKNLLSRLSCSGKGIEIRNMCHKKSKYFEIFGCTEYAKCGSDATERSVETKSCATCDVATCDECRIHCVYQTIYQAPSDLNDPSELPCFSGFVMLHPHEQPILSPHHLPTDGTHDISRWEDPSKSSSGPYHDQGYLDVPLELSVTAPPEAIEDILDLDLGQRALPLVSEDSRHGHGFPSPVLNSICRVVDARKIELCEWCFKDKAPYGPAATIPFGDFVTSLPWLTRTTAFSPIEPCHCTLRTRFLDRWLCLRCYENEENVIGECTVDSPMKNARMCQCGWISSHTLCLWCWGEVTEETGEVEDEASDHTTSSENYDEDSDHTRDSQNYDEDSDHKRDPQNQDEDLDHTTSSEL
jgi:hypothetical protein